MTFSETRETISSILVGLIVFIVLAILLGGQGQRILALLATLAAIGLIAWLISKQSEGKLEAQIIDNPVSKRGAPEIMVPESLDLPEIAMSENNGWDPRKPYY